MIIASLELFEDIECIQNTAITAYELLEISKTIRGNLRRIAENMQILEDLGHKFVINKFSVDVELDMPSITDTKNYFEKIGLDVVMFDFIETDVVK